MNTYIITSVLIAVVLLVFLKLKYKIMSINRIDARARIKRSILTGVEPTIPVSSDFTDGTWLNTDTRPGEFFVNLEDRKLWIGVTPYGSPDIGFIEILTDNTIIPVNNLAAVLAAGNTTGANDIILSGSRVIKSGLGGVISLNYTGAVQISADDNASGNGLYISNGFTQLKDQGYLMLQAFSGVVATPQPSIFLDVTGTGVVQLSAAAVTANDVFSHVVTAGNNISMFGTTNTNTAGDYNFFTGLSNTNTIGDANTIFGNTNNNISGNYNFISGGLNTNTAGDYNTILGDSNINTVGSNNFIAGNGNTITSGSYSAILGGTGNTIDSNGDRNAIIAGNGNTIVTGSSHRRNLVSGTGNSIDHTSAVIGSYVCGSSNISKAGNSILTGAFNTMHHIGIMYGAVSGSTIGSNGLTNNGTTTTNATPAVLTFAVPSNVGYRVRITALATIPATGACKEWEGFGIIKNLAGTTSLVGAGITMTSTFADAGLATAILAAAANNGTDTLDLTVTGIAATTINWIIGISYEKVIIA